VIRRIHLFLLLLFALAPALSSAGVYQWSVETGHHNHGRAYLWVPPDCAHVRAIVFGQQVILEKYVFEYPLIRETLSSECMAEVLVARGFDTTFTYSKDKGEESADKYLTKILHSLAEESGYAELDQAPLLPIAHSGACIGAWNMAYAMPARTLAVVGLHCVGSSPPAWDPKARVDGIPILQVSGEYESWGNPRRPLDQHWRWLRGQLLGFRAQYERSEMSVIVEPGGSHFSFNPELAEYVALFLHKAAKYRLSTAAGNYSLREISLEDGWLTDIDLLKPGVHAPAPYRDYTGDSSLAFWHMDRELALAAENFCANTRGKRDQRLTFVQDGKQLPAEWLETVPFVPDADGRTVHFAADFLAATPTGVLDSGKPLGHSAGAIRYTLIGGWQGGGEQTGDSSFRIAPSNFGLPDNLFVLAWQPGDAEYKWAEQAAQVKYPLRLTAGRAQKISFPKPADLTASSSSIELKAKSDSGLPVEFFVRSGPAEIEGSRLHLTKIPVGAKMPTKITIVAWQYGRASEPAVQSAEPMEQTILVTAP
jgi:hypothetical protein